MMKSCYQLIKDILVCEKTFAFMYLRGAYNIPIIFIHFMKNTIFEKRKQVWIKTTSHINTPNVIFK